MLDLIYNSATNKKDIFGKEGVNKYHCASFFFQCLATGILALEWGNGSVSLVISRDADGNELYKDVMQWEGFRFRNAGQGRAMKYLSFQDV